MTDRATRPASQFDVSRILRETSLRCVEYHPELASTSDTARELLAQLLDAGPAVVLADVQTAGRGRSGRSWFSTAGALTCSVVLDAAAIAVPPAQRGLISIAAGAAVHDAIAARGPGSRAGVKWPNDVMIDERKVCGILTEQIPAGDRQGLLIGIGINVNNSVRDAPPEIRDSAVALCDIRPEAVSLTELLIDLLNRLDHRLQQLQRSPGELVQQLNTIHVLNGKRVVIQSGVTRHEGICQEIAIDGALIIRTPAGDRTPIRAGTVLTF